jgi:hypothetical protein
MASARSDLAPQKHGRTCLGSVHPGNSMARRWERWICGIPVIHQASFGEDVEDFVERTLTEADGVLEVAPTHGRCAEAVGAR